LDDQNNSFSNFAYVIQQLLVDMPRY